MLIDISSISDNKFSGKINIVEKKMLEIDDYTAIVSLMGIVINNNGLFEFDGFIEGVIHPYCSKCLKELTVPYKRHLRQLFTRDLEQVASKETSTSQRDRGLLNLDDFNVDEILVFKGNKADFEPVIAGIIRGDMPFAVKCSNSCKGLCLTCGIDYNVSDCDCKDNYVNPTFEILKDLIIDDK